MTPKEKAIELLSRIESASMQSHSYNKACALVAVDEVLYILEFHHLYSKNYWKEVRHEIEKL